MSDVNVRKRKRNYKKKRKKNRPTDRQIDGKRRMGKKGREETEDRENRREDRKIKKEATGCQKSKANPARTSKPPSRNFTRSNRAEAN